MAIKSFVFRFDDIEVREREFSLLKAGQVLPVEPKAFRALLFLLHNPQRLISKEELLNSVWGDAAVTEGSLTRCIWLLRSLLGDDIRSPRYIETVATVGYRFMRKVDVFEEASGEPEATEAPDDLSGVGKKDRRRRRGRSWVLVGGVFILCLAGAIWYLRHPLPPLRVTGYTQITHDGQQKVLVGTDGNRLYFNQANRDLESPGSIAQVAIAGGEIATIPVALQKPSLYDVSPDGSSFLIGSVGPPFYPPFWNVRILGGSIRRLADADCAAFSPDGNSVAYFEFDAEDRDNVGGIYVERSDGAGAHKLAPAKDWVRDIAWSPDGGTIRFTMNDRIWEITPTGSNLHQLIPSWRPSSERCCGRWTPDRSFYVFQSEGQIWALDERRGLIRRSPAEPIQLTDGPIRWGEPFPTSPRPREFRGGPIPSKDGSKIFALGVKARGELSRFDAKSKQFQHFLGGISVQGVVFSKDGKSIAYVSYPEGILWKANRDGSNPVQLTDPPIQACWPRWSPDGAKIVFSDLSSASSHDLITSYVVPAEGGSPQKVLLKQPEWNGGVDWSPDGHKIIGSSVSADGKSVLSILDLDTHQVTAVPGSDELDAPRWSPDGRHLFAIVWDMTFHAEILDFKTQQWSKLAQEDVQSAEWSRDSQFLYFKRGGDHPGLFRIRVRGGVEENIGDLKDWHDASWWGGWMGLDPTDAPLLLRDIGSDDIYALTLEEK